MPVTKEAIRELWRRGEISEEDATQGIARLMADGREETAKAPTALPERSGTTGNEPARGTWRSFLAPREMDLSGTPGEVFVREGLGKTANNAAGFLGTLATDTVTKPVETLGGFLGQIGDVAIQAYNRGLEMASKKLGAPSIARNLTIPGQSGAEFDEQARQRGLDTTQDAGTRIETAARHLQQTGGLGPAADVAALAGGAQMLGAGAGLRTPRQVFARAPLTEAEVRPAELPAELASERVPKPPEPTWRESVQGRANKLATQSLGMPLRKNFVKKRGPAVQAALEANLVPGLKQFEPTPENLAKLQDQRAAVGQQIGEHFQQVAPAEIPVAAIMQRAIPGLEQLRAKYIADPAALEQIVKAEAMLTSPTPELAAKMGEGGTIPADVANQVKQGFYDRPGMNYGTPDPQPVATVAKKILANALKDEINAAHPELKALNERYAKLATLEDAAAPKILRGQNNQRIGLAKPLAVLAIHTALPTNWLKVPAAAMAVLDASPVLQMKLAGALDRFSRAGIKVNPTEIAKAIKNNPELFPDVDNREQIAELRAAEPARAAAEQAAWAREKADAAAVAEAAKKANERGVRRILRRREEATGPVTVERDRAAAEQDAWVREKYKAQGEAFITRVLNTLAMERQQAAAEPLRGERQPAGLLRPGVFGRGRSGVFPGPGGELPTPGEPPLAPAAPRRILLRKNPVLDKAAADAEQRAAEGEPSARPVERPVEPQGSPAGAGAGHLRRGAQEGSPREEARRVGAGLPAPRGDALGSRAVAPAVEPAEIGAGRPAIPEVVTERRTDLPRRKLIQAAINRDWSRRGQFLEMSDEDLRAFLAEPVPPRPEAVRLQALEGRPTQPVKTVEHFADGTVKTTTVEKAAPAETAVDVKEAAQQEARPAKGAVTETPPAPATKKPWEMTREEYLDNGTWKKNMEQAVRDASPLRRAEKRRNLRASVKAEQAKHEDAVRMAVKHGEPVPPEVLAEYPDLATKPEAPAPRKILRRTK